VSREAADTVFGIGFFMLMQVAYLITKHGISKVDWLEA
jgi:hypothetical protein